MSHASWLSDIFIPNRLRISARTLAKKINADKKKLKINCIAVSGTSGLGMGAIVSYLTNLPLIVVRKNTTDCHSGYMCEYDEESICKVDKGIKSLNYCIIDDLVSTGKTVRHIHDEICRWNYRSNLIKIYLYSDQGKTNKRTIKIGDLGKFKLFTIKNFPS